MSGAPPSPPPGPVPHPSLPPTLPDVRCVRCGYNLRGLTINHLCPECGTPAWGSYTPYCTSGLAVASLVLGIIAIPGCLAYGIPAVICGILAVRFAKQADRQIEAGQASPASYSMSRAGRTCGWIGIGLSLVGWGTVALLILLSQGL